MKFGVVYSTNIAFSKPIYHFSFCNELSENFRETPAFRPKSVWKLPKGHASLEVFLSRLEKELFSDDISESTQSNLSAEEWKALRGLAADKTIVIKGADKGSSVVVWDRSDYLHEASRQLQDQNIYENVKFNENILTDLVAKSNKIFKRLCSHKLISEKELKYFTHNFKKPTNLRKLYFLPKIHKADVIGLYSSISHEAGLEALRKILIERDSPKAPTEDIVQVAEFALKNNFFEFNGEVKRQNQEQLLAKICFSLCLHLYG